jgi:hypothetical protein
VEAEAADNLVLLVCPQEMVNKEEAQHIQAQQQQLEAAAVVLVTRV